MFCTAWLWALNTRPLLPLGRALAGSDSPHSHGRSQRRLLQASLFILSRRCSQAHPGCVPRSTPRHRHSSLRLPPNGRAAACREAPHSPPAQPSAVTRASPAHPSVLARLASSCEADKLNLFPMIFQGDEDVVTSDCLFLWP